MLRSRSRKEIVGLALVAALLLLAAGTALGSQLANGSSGYTGCLSPSGDLTKLAVGDTPLKPCTGNQIEAHLASSDITSIIAGTGLTSSAANGAVTIAIDPAYALPQGCNVYQVARWNGSTWVCSDAVAPLP